MHNLANVRKASRALGDDTTLTRWIKEPTRHTSGKSAALMPADATGTRFRSRVIKPADMGALLVSGYSNVKIGRDVRKGRLKGYWIYTLSLEERATCPTSCGHWRDCYGGSMPFAKRVDHTAEDFLPRLEAEIARLCHTRRHSGVLVRLHALGDFYSVAYTQFWRQMLAQHQSLAVFGYTARDTESDIGWIIRGLNAEFQERSMIRFSDAVQPFMATVSIARSEDRPANAFLCPEQTGQTQCCATCAACWSTIKNVAFAVH